MQISKGWKEVLEGEFQQEYILDLKKFIEDEVKRGIEVYPPLEEVFSALKASSYQDTKVVIVGQDPYHGPFQAHGLSFSVRKGVAIPPSLKNIYKELKADLGLDIPQHGCLEKWASQGVLLLNSTLTVRRGEPKSHYGRGWERFTSAIIQKLFEREDPIVFLLWGKSAEEKCRDVFDGKKTVHAVLKASHPSPYSASGFLGCKHFSRANDLLEGWGKKPIDWSLS